MSSPANLTAAGSLPDEVYAQIGGLLNANRSAEAEALARRTLAEHPGDLRLQHDLAIVLAKQQKFPEAQKLLQHVTGELPQWAEATINLGKLYQDTGQLPQAEECCRRVVQLEPESAAALTRLGHVLRRRDMHDDSLAVLDQALALDPKFVDALYEKALTLSDMSRSDDAKQVYETLLTVVPDHYGAINNLGVLCESRGDFEEAAQHLRRATELRPNLPDGFNNLGVVLAAQTRHAEAIDCYRRALQLTPHAPSVLSNLGNALRSEGHLDEAVLRLREAIRLRPDYAEAYNNLAIVHVQRGEHAEAMECYDQAVYLRPNYPEARMNRALDWLAQGEFERGWVEYEWRWKHRGIRVRNYPRPRWDGSDPTGRRLFVYYEQGFGDTFQFARYMPILAKMGARVILEVPKPLVKILQNCPGVETVVAATDREIPDFDLHVPLMAVPGLLNTKLETIPANVPYLFADDELIEQWRDRLPSDGLRVGIAWQGNPEYRGDRQRSVPLRHFEVLGQIEGVKFIALQKGFGIEQVDEVADKLSIDVFPEMDTTAGAFMDTAAIMKNLDLVITSDTAIPHLAGALGVPVWMATPAAADWRWLHDREDSPWYPTMRIFRQQGSLDWQPVFEKIAVELRARMASVRSSAQAPTDEQRQQAREFEQQGNAQTNGGSLDEAAASFQKAVDLDPQLTSARHNLGVIEARRGRLDQAMVNFRRAIELKPDFVDAYANLGLAFLEKGQIDESISHLRRALQLGPNSPETHNNLGVALLERQQPEAAISSFEQALKIRPDYPEAHVNCARGLLTVGQFDEGWREFEWRSLCSGSQPRRFDQPRWMGLPAPESTVLLHAEQGICDTLQMIRYAELVKQRVGRVILQCQAELVPILKKCPHIDEVIAAHEPPPSCNYQVPLLSLPGLFRTSLGSIPRKVPYLRVEEQLADHWQQRLSHVQGLKVGIAWQGNPRDIGDAARSLPLAEFQPLGFVPNVSFISLQQGQGTEQLAAAGRRLSVVDLGPDIDAQHGFLVDTAAILGHLDLVITCDSHIAHLAGALGVPVWVVLGTSPDYRWMLHRDDSPWYPSLRLFRRAVHGSWQTVMQEVASALAEFCGQAVPRRNREIFSDSAAARSSYEQGRQQCEAGNLADAVRSFRSALSVDPQLARAHHDLGVALAQQGNLEEGSRHLQQALALDDRIPEGPENLARALLAQKNFEQAAKLARTGLEKGTRSPGLYFILGSAQAVLGDPQQAAESFQAALELNPKFGAALQELGSALRLQGKFNEAITAYEQALELNGESADLLNNLGLTYAQQEHADRAEACYRQALDLDSEHVEAWNNLGVTLADAHDLAGAETALRRVVYYRPTWAEAHRNLAIVLLLEGKLAEGWEEYEWRWRSDDNRSRPWPAKPWSGNNLNGARLLLFAEQGLGDTIQFIRYVRLLDAQGATVYVQGQPALEPLLSQCAGVTNWIEGGQQLPEIDGAVPMLSVPRLLATTLESVPAEVPYIQPVPELVQAWSKKLPAAPLRIGIAWQGSPTYAGDAARSIPLEYFAPLAAIDGVQLISLQKGLGTEQIAALAEPFSLTVFDELDEQGAFMDTAAIMAGLDLIVTSDSAVAHLAGATGAKVWMPLGRKNDWRWLRERTDCPWYPTMRLFRQPALGEWTGVFQTICEEIQQTWPDRTQTT